MLEEAVGGGVPLTAEQQELEEFQRQLAEREAELEQELAELGGGRGAGGGSAGSEGGGAHGHSQHQQHEQQHEHFQHHPSPWYHEAGAAAGLQEGGAAAFPPFTAPRI